MPQAQINTPFSRKSLKSFSIEKKYPNLFNVSRAMQNLLILWKDVHYYERVLKSIRGIQHI